MKEILVIQTAFLGDVILALPVLKQLKRYFPKSSLHFLVRSPFDTLVETQSYIDKVWVWDKRRRKYRHLFRLLYQLRRYSFDVVINLQRFFSTGLLTCLLRTRERRGFRKNPFSWCFDKRFIHCFDGRHEIERNLSLLEGICPTSFKGPWLEIPQEVSLSVESSYIVVAPASVWFTKQYPWQLWRSVVGMLRDYPIYLIGASKERAFCEQIAEGFAHVHVLAGHLTLLQSAALIKNALLVIANDSAPTHLASALNVPTITLFCSTLPSFGFYPLADRHIILEPEPSPDCRPCGVHGKRYCPMKHFQCAYNITPQRVVEAVRQLLQND